MFYTWKREILFWHTREVIIILISFFPFLVYCACLLASHGIPFGFETGSNPLFFTNVCDLTALKDEHKYIACKFKL